MSNNLLKDQVDQELEDIRRQALKKARVKQAVKTVLQIFLPALIIIVLLNNIIGIAPVYGESMEPTLYANDWIVFNRLDKTPERYDIFIAKKSSSERQIIKRVIGLPGETVDIIDSKIYINGELLDESSYHTQGITETHDVQFPVTLGEDEYLVLGDNREVSLDSRSSATGMISQSHILGKVLFFIRFF